MERISTSLIIGYKAHPHRFSHLFGSGLDPHISPQAAYWQAPEIALQRDVALKRVVSIINDHIQSSKFYILGDPRVNVLRLNLTLDQFFGPPVEAK